MKLSFILLQWSKVRLCRWNHFGMTEAILNYIDGSQSCRWSRCPAVLKRHVSPQGLSGRRRSCLWTKLKDVLLQEDIITCMRNFKRPCDNKYERRYQLQTHMGALCNGEILTGSSRPGSCDFISSYDFYQSWGRP